MAKYKVKWEITGEYFVTDEDLEGSDAEELTGEAKLDEIKEIEENEMLPGLDDPKESGKINVTVEEAV